MRIISHRGNIDGPGDSLSENQGMNIASLISDKPDIIVEIDLWKIGSKLFLSHDRPDFTSSEVGLDYLTVYRHNLLIHTKNREALELLRTEEYDDLFHYFTHQNDDYAISSRNFIIVFPGKQVIDHYRTIVMLPELGTAIPKNIYGICTDFVRDYENLLAQV